MFNKSTLILAVCIVALTSFSVPADETNKDKNDKKKEVNEKKEKKRCGPAFKINNYSGNVVTKFTYTGPNQTTVVVNNPTFPYDIPQQSTSVFTIKFTFASTASGVIVVTDSASGEVIVCETYEAPYASPVGFFAGCYFYRINIYSDANAPACP